MYPAGVKSVLGIWGLGLLGLGAVPMYGASAFDLSVDSRWSSGHSMGRSGGQGPGLAFAGSLRPEIGLGQRTHSLSAIRGLNGAVRLGLNSAGRSRKRTRPVAVWMQTKEAEAAATPAVSIAKIDVSAPQNNDSMLLLVRLTVLGVAAMYGTNFGSVKIIQEFLPTDVAASLRFSLAAVALLPLLRTLKKEAILPGLQVGFLTGCGYLAQGLGLESADASTAAFLCSLGVVVCPLLDVFIGKSVESRSWIAALLAVAGAGVLELGGVKPPGSGDLWDLVQPLAFGSSFWLTEQTLRRCPDQAGPLTSLQIGTVAFMSLFWTWCDNKLGPQEIAAIQTALQHQSVAVAVIWTGLATTALSVLLETWALKRLSSAETTVLFSTEPIWGLAFASVALGEQLSWNTFLGGGLILAACASTFTGGQSGSDSKGSQ